MYEVPSPEEVKRFIITKELTGADIAALTGAKLRTVSGWLSPPSRKSSSNISWAEWTLLQLLTGHTTRDEVLVQVDTWKRAEYGRGLGERAPQGRPPVV